MKLDGADWTQISATELVAQHLARKPATARAYRQDLQTVGRFLGLPVDDLVEAACNEAIVEAIVDKTRGVAQMMLDRYASTMRSEGIPTNTIRRRIASTLSLLSLAHRYDVIAWSISITLPTTKAVKDTKGPGVEAVRAMFDICQSRDDSKGVRDLAIMSLLYYHALRRAEVTSTELSRFDPKRQTIEIKAKGKDDRVTIPLIPAASDYIEAWIEVRGDWPGPLFTSCNPRGKDRDPLTDQGVYQIVRALGDRVGVRTSPHGIRHTATS